MQKRKEGQHSKEGGSVHGRAPVLATAADPQTSPMQTQQPRPLQDQATMFDTKSRSTSTSAAQ